MSNSKPVGPSVELEASEDQAVKVSLASKGSTISSDRVKGVQEVLVILSAIFSKNSRKCSVEAAVARGAHKEGLSNKLKVKTLL